MIRQRFDDVRTTIGPPAEAWRKLQLTVETVRCVLDRDEQLTRIERLRASGETDVVPTRWQLSVGAYHMMTRFIIPSNDEFYRHYEGSAAWLQLLRFLDDPPTMLDPIGLAISRDALIKHIVHVVHTSAGYDVALLRMFEDGLAELERHLELLIAGEHPEQAAIEATLERPDYHRRLLEAVRAYVDDPVRNWRVETYEAPDDCEALYDWGIERFGSPGRLFAYAHTLPASPWASLRQWWSPKVAGSPRNV